MEFHMTDGVMSQAVAEPEVKKEDKSQGSLSDKELNFRRLENQRDEERERRIRAEMEAQLLKQRMDHIEKQLQQPEIDPLDGVEDYVDPKRLKAVLEKERTALKKEAEEITERKLRELRDQEHKQNHVARLRSEFRDYDEVMNENNIANLEKTNPVFLKAVLQIQDDYERKKLAYEYLKQSKPKVEDVPSIKEKVDENLRNPYYIPSGSGNGMAVEFDIRSTQARKDAYDKLKQAQRRPVGSGFAPQR